ncbi:MAG: hypothetical protein DWQ02_08975 [Bacteroidetes bacterium]|nr:MAG: hypothetical protein DWQ02_08975 [Bacteroidota bacterium]
MKTIFWPVFILTWSLVLSGLWIIQPNEAPASLLEFIFVGIIVVFFALGVYFGYNRFRNKQQGFPEDDEMSKKITQKAAALSFYIGVFLWVILIYIQSHTTIGLNWILASGMIGMALTFIISWSILSIGRIKFEQ